MRMNILNYGIDEYNLRSKGIEIMIEMGIIGVGGWDREIGVFTDLKDRFYSFQKTITLTCYKILINLFPGQSRTGIFLFGNKGRVFMLEQFIRNMEIHIFKYSN